MYIQYIFISRNQIYLSIWNNPNSTIGIVTEDSKIFTPLENITVFLPHSLYISQNSLYWLDNAPGIYFTLQEYKLDTMKQSQVYKGKYQRPFALAKICPQIFIWIDGSTNTIWQLDLAKENVQSEIFEIKGPQSKFRGLRVSESTGKQFCEKKEEKPTPKPISKQLDSGIGEYMGQCEVNICGDRNCVVFGGNAFCL